MKILRKLDEKSESLAYKNFINSLTKANSFLLSEQDYEGIKDRLDLHSAIVPEILINFLGYYACVNKLNSRASLIHTNSIDIMFQLSQKYHIRWQK